MLVTYFIRKKSLLSQRYTSHEKHCRRWYAKRWKCNQKVAEPSNTRGEQEGSVQVHTLSNLSESREALLHWNEWRDGRGRSKNYLKGCMLFPRLYGVRVPRVHLDSNKKVLIPPSSFPWYLGCLLPRDTFEMSNLVYTFLESIPNAMAVAVTEKACMAYHFSLL